MQASSALKLVLRRDQALVLGGLFFVAALAWGYTLYTVAANPIEGSTYVD